MRTILLATLLAGYAWTAHAADQPGPQTWNFSYTGFNLTYRHVDEWNHVDQTTTTFEPDITFKGSFSGTDGNHDGVIDLSELSAFTFNGLDYYGCTFSPQPYTHCTLPSFSYTLTGQLGFSATLSGNDEFYMSWSDDVTSGVGVSRSSYGRFTGDIENYAWTSQTQFSITPIAAPPVPEPANGAMAAAGVLLLGVLRRRRLTKAR